MAFNPGTEAIVYLNGYDISGYLKSAGVSGSRDLYDSTTLGDTDREFVGGLGNAVFNADGLYEADSVSPKIDDLLYAALELGANAILTHLPAGDGLGNRGIGIDGEESTYDISSPVDELVSVTLEVQSSVGAEPVRVLHPIGAETVTGNGTGVDNGASSADGGSAYLHVTAHDRTTGDETATIRVQHSVDDVVYADLITFTAIASATPQAQRGTATGTVNRYVRARHELAGITPSTTYHLAFSRH